MEAPWYWKVHEKYGDFEVWEHLLSREFHVVQISTGGKINHRSQDRAVFFAKRYASLQGEGPDA